MPKKNTRKKEKKSLRHRIKLTLQLLILILLLAIAGGIFYFYHAYGKQILKLQADAKQKVVASTEDTFKASQTSLVYDAEGNLISALKAEKDVYYIDYEAIPDIAIKAMVVSEDRKFLEHNGVDYLANIRAAIALIKHKGEITQGASTITQQLARSVFLTQKVTYERKIEEIFVAQELEKLYTKSEIMEFYINGMYFANGHYGLQAAALGYFGEGVSGLSLSQIVFLCAIPNSPNRYNPLTNIENTLERRNRILDQLYEEGMISEEQYEDARKEEISLHQNKAKKRDYVETYSYYCAVRALMKEAGFTFRNQFDSEADRIAYEEEYENNYNQYQKDLFVRGYRIYTSIDLKKQKLLQKSLDHVLEEFKEKNEEGVYQMQGAAVCIDNDSGRVVAIVGGREQKLPGYTLNRGYQSFRQPGSAIKPLIVYTPSFERNYTPDSVVVDEKIKDGPRNAGGGYSGTIKLQRAIELSKNTIAWKLLQELTPKVGLSYLINMNFAKLKASDYNLAAALGGLTVGTSPVEMAAAYATLENDGYYRTPTCIVKIMDSEGNEIIGDTPDTKKIYESNAARIMTEALTGVIKHGTAVRLGLTNTISAGKTGTTNDKKDGWFVGYTPYYTTSVWVGNDMPKPVSNLTGATYPGAIWHDFMDEIHTKEMTREFDSYDWRAVLQAEKEAKEKIKAQEEAEKKAEEDASQNNSSSLDDAGALEDPDYQEVSGSQDTSENQDSLGELKTTGEEGNQTDGSSPMEDTQGQDSDEPIDGVDIEDVTGVEESSPQDSANQENTTEEQTSDAEAAVNHGEEDKLSEDTP